MSYLYLAGAIFFEVFATMLLPLSQGFTHKIPSIALILGYMLSFYCLSHALQTIPLAIVYATWAGMGVFLVAVLSYFIYSQSITLPAGLGMMLIICGVTLVNTYAKPAG